MQPSNTRIDFSVLCDDISCPFQLACRLSEVASDHLSKVGYTSLEAILEQTLSEYRRHPKAVFLRGRLIDDSGVDRAMEMAIASLVHTSARMLRDGN